MKVAVVYNRESTDVINLFGQPNLEKYGLHAIRRITDALKKGGHQVIALEGDKNLIRRLEEFMPKVLHHERPGMVFNVSYGIQGQARYTHVPGILEMIGIPYVGSGPLAHSLALDKLVAKMIFKQVGLPTPEYIVLSAPDAPIPEFTYPAIVKPKNESVSFGIKIVHDADEMKDAARVIFEKFSQPVLVEQFIDGREVNVGVLGNPPQALPPVELTFGDGPRIYTEDDKKGKSGRTVDKVCPAPLSDALTEKIKDVAVRAFESLGCFDCARVDLRIDADDNPYILEINSLPSLGEHGSFVEAAEAAGLDFTGLVNELVKVASARYFATPAVTEVGWDANGAQDAMVRTLIQSRDKIERRVKELVAIPSRTDDLVGLRDIVRSMDKPLRELGLSRLRDLTDDRYCWSYETEKGLDDGTLLIVQIDVPSNSGDLRTPFRRDPEWLYGDGVGVSRAPLAVVEFALKALKSHRRLKPQRLGVLLYGDEGLNAIHSSDKIRAAATRAKNAIVIRPGTQGGQLVSERRGLRTYRLLVEGSAKRLGQPSKKSEPLRWTCQCLEKMATLSNRKERIAVAASNIRANGLPGHLPHVIRAEVLVSHSGETARDRIDSELRKILGKDSHRWDLESVSDRPAFKRRSVSQSLLKQVESVAERWQVPCSSESSLSPSVAGLVPDRTAALCGFGPAVVDVYTANEAVQRISLMQTTLLLAGTLAEIGS